jgi:hypothetical protein
MYSTRLILINYLPTFGWSLFMLTGVVLNSLSIHSNTLSLLAASTVFLAFALSDSISIILCKTSKAKPSDFFSAKKVSNSRILWLLVIASLIIIAIRINLIGFDLISDIITHQSKAIITASRIVRTRPEGIRKLLFVLQNIGFSFIFPASIIFLLSSKSLFHRFTALSLGLIISIVALMGGERFPFFAFITPIVVFFIICVQIRFTTRQPLFFFGSLLAGFILSILITISYHSSPQYRNFSTSPQISLTSQPFVFYSKYLPKPQYHMHLLSQSPADRLVGSSSPIVDSLRRSFLIPSDVAYHYYAIFPRLLPHSQTLFGSNYRYPFTNMTLPNLVGDIIYRAKFPSHYLPGVAAYGSFDSDAYARFGPIGFLLTLLLLSSFRILASYYSHHSSFSYVLYICILCSLFWLPSSASTQAMFFSHGFLLILTILVLVSWIRPFKDMS